MVKKTVKVLVVFAALILTLGVSAYGLGAAYAASDVAAQKGFGLDSIPEIKNKAPIHIMVEASGSGDTIVAFIQKFAAKTGVPVTFEMIVMSSAYAKQLNELQSYTGAYDMVMVETSWTNEWADYLIDIGSAAEQYDPQGRAGLEADLVNYDPGLLRCASTADGVLMGLTYYSYPCFQFIRKDVFENEIEKENFKAKYHYDLAPAKTWDQIHDQGEFFTRKRGELLKGEVLEHDVYGLGMMAGQFPHVQDEMAARIWSLGGHFASPVRDASGKLTGFNFTKKRSGDHAQSRDRLRSGYAILSPRHGKRLLGGRGQSVCGGQHHHYAQSV